MIMVNHRNYDGEAKKHKSMCRNHDAAIAVCHSHNSSQDQDEARTLRETEQ